MFRHRSDINNRLPLFRDTMSAFNEMTANGVFDGIDQNVLDYVKAAEPVGVNRSGRIVLPDSYQPENGPPVLLLQPGEKERVFKMKGTPVEAAMTESIASQSRVRVTIDPSLLNHQTSPLGDFGAAINTQQITITRTGQEQNPYQLCIPRIMLVSPDIPRESLPPILVHETDHWNFYLNTAGRLQSNPARHYSRPELASITEKSAYAITHRMAVNLGTCATSLSVADIAHKYSGMSPELTGKALDAACIREEICHPLAVQAMTEMFGLEGQLITSEEVTAFLAAGIVER